MLAPAQRENRNKKSAGAWWAPRIEEETDCGQTVIEEASQCLKEG